MFSLMGPGHTYTYDEYGDIVGTAGFGSGKVIRTYASLEPRVSATYLIDDASSVKGSYTRTAQYLHLLSNSTTANPSDLWVPSSNNVPPQYADQYAVGYYRNYQDNQFESSVELYYKNMGNLIDYKNGADLQINPTVESLLVFGRGWSYGAEFLLRKRAGRLSGWVGYTWSKTQNQFPLINNGAVFPARQDRTHDISIVAIYDLNANMEFLRRLGVQHRERGHVPRRELLDRQPSCPLLYLEERVQDARLPPAGSLGYVEARRTFQT